MPIKFLTISLLNALPHVRIDHQYRLFSMCTCSIYFQENENNFSCSKIYPHEPAKIIFRSKMLQKSKIAKNGKASRLRILGLVGLKLIVDSMKKPRWYSCPLVGYEDMHRNSEKGLHFVLMRLVNISWWNFTPDVPYFVLSKGQETASALMIQPRELVKCVLLGSMERIHRWKSMKMSE